MACRLLGQSASHFHVLIADDHDRADACGFADDTTEELCSRWMAMAAFTPFYRNHNNLRSHNQEPYLWDSVRRVSVKYTGIRYQLLPYIASHP
jgi:alpha-glucosidase (family GH31 glycosyl hydrolase)